MTPMTFVLLVFLPMKIGTLWNEQNNQKRVAAGKAGISCQLQLYAVLRQAHAVVISVAVGAALNHYLQLYLLLWLAY